MSSDRRHEYGRKFNVTNCNDVVVGKLLAAERVCQCINFDILVCTLFVLLRVSYLLLQTQAWVGSFSS